MALTLLICGHQASGKSTLRRVLDTHPQVTVLADFGAFRSVGGSRRAYVQGLRLQRRYLERHQPLSAGFCARFLTRLAWRTGRRGPVEFEEVDRALQGLLPESRVIGDVANGYLEVAAREAGRPNVRTIVVYRDCRDVAATIQERFDGRWRHLLDDPSRREFVQQIDTPEKIARRWAALVDESTQLRGEVLPVHYEQLVTEPAVVLTGIGQWLGVRANGFDSSWLRSDEVGRYRDVLDTEQIETVEAVAGGAMRQLGYDVR